MPIPKPKEDEKQEEFIERFMANPDMQKDFPDDNQRMGVAQTTYEEGIKEFKDIADAKKETVFSIENVEIFKTGKWNGDKYTTKDLDEMELSFKEIGGQIKPFLKLGHNKAQNLLSSDGLPAAGWIKNVRREGESLMADFFNIPKKIHTLIANKQYGRMSSEIYWNLKANNKTYKRVLKAVALLGADTPAVQTLDDFINLYTENEIEYQEIKDYYNITKESDMPELKIYQDKIEVLETQLKDYAEIKIENEKLKTELKEFSDKVDALETEKAKIYTEKRTDEVKVFLDKALEEGKILPAQVEMYTNLALEEKTYTIDKKELSSFEMVKDIVGANEKQADFSEKTKHEEIEKNKSDEDKLFDKATKYAEEKKVDFKTAMIAVEQEAE